MFSVIFEVHPKPDQWDAYLGEAKMLRPELEQVDGFVDNIRYKSLSREGWILSLSGWRDEKSVVRWRTAKRHHMVQEKGRIEILLDRHVAAVLQRLGIDRQYRALRHGVALRNARTRDDDRFNRAVLCDCRHAVRR